MRVELNNLQLDPEYFRQKYNIIQFLIVLWVGEGTIKIYRISFLAIK